MLPCYNSESLRNFNFQNKQENREFIRLLDLLHWIQYFGQYVTQQHSEHLQHSCRPQDFENCDSLYVIGSHFLFPVCQISDETMSSVGKWFKRPYFTLEDNMKSILTDFSCMFICVFCSHSILQAGLTTFPIRTDVLRPICTCCKHYFFSSDYFTHMTWSTALSYFRGWEHQSSYGFFPVNMWPLSKPSCSQGWIVLYVKWAVPVERDLPLKFEAVQKWG